MTYFEAKGIEIQGNSLNEFQARKQFENSCERCCMRGLRIDCDACGIKAAHERVIEAFSERKLAASISAIRRCQVR